MVRSPNTEATSRRQRQEWPMSSANLEHDLARTGPHYLDRLATHDALYTGSSRNLNVIACLVPASGSLCLQGVFTPEGGKSNWKLHRILSKGSHSAAGLVKAASRATQCLQVLGAASSECSHNSSIKRCAGSGTPFCESSILGITSSARRVST